MIEKQTTVDQIEITRSGAVQVRFGLRLVEDGRDIAPVSWHRTVFMPGDDIDAQMAIVNGHLISMGKAAVADAEVERIRAHAATAWTPEVIAAYQEQQAARETAT